MEQTDFPLLSLDTLADDDDTLVTPPPDHIVTFAELVQESAT